MNVDLTRAAVRPAGHAGIATRTAAGFIVLGSADAGPLLTFIDERQTEPDLIEQLAARVPASNPTALAMLFTAGGEPWLLAWGAATATVTSDSMRFTVTPVSGEVLVHPLAVAANARVVLATGPLDGDPVTAPINLADGSMPADAVVIEFDGLASPVAPAPVTPAAPPVATPPATTPVPELPTGTFAQATEPPPVPLADASFDAPDLDRPRTGPPAAEEIIFAEDLDEISDLIDEAPQTSPAGFDAPTAFGSAPITAIELAGPVPVDDGGFDALTPHDTEHVDGAGVDMSQLDGTDGPADTDDDHAVGFDAPMGATRDQPVDDGAIVVSLTATELPAAAPPPTATPVAEPNDPPAVASSPDPLPTRPSTLAPVMVLGISCPNGHHNHPDALYCTTCGAAIERGDTTVLINGVRPPLGILIADDGATHPLDSDLVLGRDPASHDDVRGGYARAVALADDTVSMSRRHALISLDEWTVRVTDLGSSNGTWIATPANADEWTNVAPHHSVEITSGDRLRLGARSVTIELHHRPG